MRAIAPLVSLLLLAPLAVASEPTLVHAAGVVRLQTALDECEVPAEFHADLALGTGVTAFGPGTCAFFGVFPFDGNDCHDLCAGRCFAESAGSVLCYFGDPEYTSWYSRLHADGTFVAQFGDWNAHGTLVRTAL